jgi:hypothetical protein
LQENGTTRFFPQASDDCKVHRWLQALMTVKIAVQFTAFSGSEQMNHADFFAFFLFRGRVLP